MTYSIVARDASTGELGVAVQSHWFSVGSVVTWAEAGAGAVATQSFAEPAYGPKGLALMRLGVDAQAALTALVSADELRARRQVAFVDANGAVAVHTGDQCIAAAGHAIAEGVSTQANMMRNDRVWPAMLEAYHTSSGDLAERLLTSLDAAETAGGDVRGRQSAAMIVVAGASSGQPWRDRRFDLRVEDSADPLGELRRLVTINRGYHRMDIAEEREVAGDVAGALAEYEAARVFLSGNDEATFWSAVLMADAGRVDEARALFDEITAREPGWAELVRRLPDTGLLRGGRSVVEELLAP
ncbi:MAG TPA: DUF1028 domain-containing protein [Candidatus Elarobacter sp.]|nr:DUF1028 domain-containing protein [Candidatus Elarobacter sp.]